MSTSINLSGSSCPNCRGKGSYTAGSEPAPGIATCHVCGGSGRVVAKPHADALAAQLAEAEARARLAEGRLSAAIAFIRSRDGAITMMDTTIDGDGHDPVERCSLPESDEGGE